jgi:hypothetical protein
MALIKGEIGIAYLIDNQSLLYMGLEAQHFSNGGLNGSANATYNASLNTPWGMVVGLSWLFR